MELKIRRYISTGLLLATFLPMLILSSVHVHQYGREAEDDCQMCMHHKVHNGHLSKAELTMHDCVLCQIFHLTFLNPSPTPTVAPSAGICLLPCEQNQTVVSRTAATTSPRAPPLF